MSIRILGFLLIPCFFHTSLIRADDAVQYLRGDDKLSVLIKNLNSTDVDPVQIRIQAGICVSHKKCFYFWKSPAIDLAPGQTGDSTLNHPELRTSPSLVGNEVNAKLAAIAVRIPSSETDPGIAIQILRLNDSGTVESSEQSWVDFPPIEQHAWDGEVSQDAGINLGKITGQFNVRIERRLQPGEEEIP